ncbi:MAG: aminodeoxychorismate/anthranilate synthase component II [Flavobacteriales bacterium]|nr:aminodeoxychorismate/anthranilate synthase component II [Flavobacteriales bacterium]
MHDTQRILVVDNYDSFTYNLVHLLEALDVQVEVRRNDALTLDEVGLFSHVLISPGPGVPEEAGIVPELIRVYKGTRSILGVCLGMQCILHAAGAEMVNMPKVQHGAKERISIDVSARLFHGLPNHVQVGRYHSWAFQPEDVPDEFRVSAVSDDGFVMAIEHVSLPLFGVQFHPESIMTEHGMDMLRNWIRG